MINIPDIVCRIAKNDEEIRQCFQIRKDVFIDEQRLFKKTDRDAKDAHSIHIVAIYKEKIVGTVRVYQDINGIWWGGRLAVEKRYRGKAGKLLIRKAVEVVKERKAKHFYANVQIENVPFFKTLKWKTSGAVFTIHKKPHQRMEADLNED